MHCLDVQVELQTYVDGDLSPERAVLLERHLASCDSCHAKLTSLQAVVTALETWPLVVEPADLTAQVMARVRSRPALPAFRLRWSDFAISLAGAGLVFVAVLAWRYLAPAALDYPLYPQIVLWLEMLRLEALLTIQRMARAGTATWGLLLGSVMLMTILVIAAWNLTAWEREALLQ